MKQRRTDDKVTIMDEIDTDELDISNKFRIFIHNEDLFNKIHEKICPTPNWFTVSEKGEADFFVCTGCMARKCPEHDEMRVVQHEKLELAVALMGKIRRIPFSAQVILEPEGMCYEFEQIISIIRADATFEQPIGLMFGDKNEASIHVVEVEELRAAQEDIEKENTLEGYA